MEVIAYSTERLELFYNTDDVEEVTVSSGITSDDGDKVPSEERHSSLKLKFKPGTVPLWREKALWLAHRRRSSSM